MNETDLMIKCSFITSFDFGFKGSLINYKTFSINVFGMLLAM